MSALAGSIGPHTLALQRCRARIQAQPAAATLALLARRDADALVEARERDMAGQHGLLSGKVLHVKALFDVQGWVTHAGSRVLADAPAASADAPTVRALQQAGAVLLAQNNMTEFAYGALGLNPWYGTPVTPLLDDAPRVAGGSSSGGAVAVAHGMADIALCSDTSGSARIPAAFCGVTGFKPSQGRYADSGMLFLSPSFDAPGIMARGVSDCLLADQALTSDGQAAGCAAASPNLSGKTFIVPAMLEDMLAAPVQQAYAAALQALRHAGATLRRASMPSLLQASQVAREAGIIGAEVYALHAQRLASHAASYDPRVGTRMLLGATVPAHSYLTALRKLAALRAQYDAEMSEADGILTPTVPMLPPRIADLAKDTDYARENVRAFSLTEFANRLDLPSVSLPLGAQPIGLLLTGRRRGDRDTLLHALAMEPHLK